MFRHTENFLCDLAILSDPVINNTQPSCTVWGKCCAHIKHHYHNVTCMHPLCGLKIMYCILKCPNKTQASTPVQVFYMLLYLQKYEGMFTYKHTHIHTQSMYTHTCM